MSGKKILGVLAVAVALLVILVATRTPELKPSAYGPIPASNAVAISRAAKHFEPVRRHLHHASNATDATVDDQFIPQAERDRMQRMAENLLQPQVHLNPADAASLRQNWVKRFHDEKDPLLREEVITEMVQLDDPETLKIQLQLLRDETDPGVRQQIVLILEYMRSTVAEIATVSPVIMNEYQQCGDSEERARILEAMSNLPTSESVKMMQEAFTASDATAQDRFNAAEGLFKLAPRVSIDPEILATFTDRLKTDARTAPDEQDRLMADRALAAPGQNNKPFLRDLLATETNSNVRNFLELATEEHPTH